MRIAVVALGVVLTVGLVACTVPAETAQPAGPVELSIPARDAILAATLRFPSAGRAPFPAIVLAHGSGLVTRGQNQPMADSLLAMGLAVLTYDKRGVGQSTGTYVNVGTARSIEVFGVLADDALAARRRALLSARKDIDGRRTLLSGPAVTVGEEMEYSRLAGADPGSIQGLSDDEIDRRMRAFKGPYGYDPVPVLESLSTPSIWIEGEHDRSVPMAQTLATLERLRAAGRPITIHKLPGADHSLRNPVTGERSEFWGRVREWLGEYGVVPRLLE